MKVYWSFLALSLLLMVLCGINYQTIYIHDRAEKRAVRGQGLVFFAVLLFFSGLRSGVADTGAYIRMFEAYPTDVKSVLHGIKENKDFGFYLFSVFFKQFISKDFHLWFFVIALVSCAATFIAFRKYSSDFGMTCFLFIATTSFTYLINGMRQYIAISIILACSGWIVEKKYLRFIILVLLLSTIHASVIIFIPLLLLVNAKPWSWKMLLIVAAAGILGLRIDLFMGLLGGLLEETQYEGYMDVISSGTGSNIIRLALAAIPVALALVGKDIVRRADDPFVNFSVNMSVLNLCVYFVATFTSGMVLGRLAAFFDVYNLFLLPWLIDHLFERGSKAFVKFACIGCYIVFFWYQMSVTWNLPYVSDILHLNL